MSCTTLARRRREILLRKDVFIDLLSWRYANAQNGGHAIRLRQLLPMEGYRPGDDSPRKEDAREEFKRFMMALDAKIGAEFSWDTQDLCEKMDRKYSLRRGGTMSRKDKLSQAEVHDDTNFVDSLCKYLAQGRYHLASPEDWSYARSHNYGVAVPITVKWTMFDKTLLKTLSPRLYNDKSLSTAGNNEKGVVSLPNEATHALLFHRGVGVDRSRNFNFGEKTDEVIRRSVVWSINQLIYRINQLAASLGKHARRVRASSVRHSKSALSSFKAKAGEFYAEKIANAVYVKPFRWVEQRLRKHISQLQAPLGNLDVEMSIALPESIRAQFEARIKEYQGDPPKKASEMSAAEVLPESAVKQAIEPPPNTWVQARDSKLDEAFRSKISISDLKMNFWNFFGRVVLQEPMYKQVVVIYRVIEPEAPSSVALNQANQFKSRGWDSSNQREPNYRNICIKYFHDIPMSDIELLLPCKQVSLSVRDRVNYGIMGLIGGSALLNAIMSSSSGFLTNPAWIAAMVASGAYYGRVASRMYMSLSYYASVTDAVWAENIGASGSPAISWIAKEAQEQLVKEIAVTMLALVELTSNLASQGNQPENILVDDLTACCQDILHQKYSHDVYLFDPTESLSILERYNLVHSTNDKDGRVHLRLPLPSSQ